jgi:predicted RNA-binding Zn-ribbon protein involved in translation (DUF1610 family)
VTKPILANPIKPEEINSSYNKSQLVLDKCQSCGKSITYTIRDSQFKKLYNYCDSCRQELLFTKKSDKPLEIDETTNLNGYNKKTEVTFKCRKCGQVVIKRISALESSGLFCKKCATLNSLKNNYGTENPFSTDIIKNKTKETIIKRYGSIENYTESRIEKAKETLKKSFGVENVFQLQEVKDKCKLSKFEKHGDENFNNREKFETTMIEKYGTAAYNNRQKAKETFLERYGADSTMHSKELKSKVAKTNKEKYGSASPWSDENVRKKCNDTKLKLYGNENFVNTEQTRKTMENKYGKWYSSTQECKDKVKNSCLEHFGVPYNFQSEDTKNKSRQTCFEKYGVYNSFQAQSTKDIYNKHMMEKYGYEWPSQVPYIRQKILHFAASKLNNVEKNIYNFLEQNNIKFDYNYDINNKNFDFAIYKNDNLDILVELDGEPFHGLTGDPDGNYFGGLYDCERFEKVPDNVKFIVCDSSNVEKCKDEIIRVLDLTYDSWIKEMINSLPKSFPYPVYDEKRMQKDYSKLKEYDYSKKAFLTRSIIYNFHKSIFTSHVGNNPSPVEAWSNSELLEKCVRNRFIYSSSLSSQAIANGFNICKIAPKVSVFNPSLAKHLIEEYLQNYSIIFDPFSGFSGRMLGACCLNKKYIGQDINKEHVDESNEIIKFLNLDATVSQKDLFESSGEYECLFTCSPYNLKETWNNETQANLSCDEWIDECLKRFKCKKYMFVVDKTEKYKDKIVEEIKNKSHFGENSEYIVLI